LSKVLPLPNQYEVGTGTRGRPVQLHQKTADRAETRAVAMMPRELPLGQVDFVEHTDG